MAIKVNGTTVINDSRALQNIASVDSTTLTTLGNAGLGGVDTGASTPSDASGSAGDLFFNTTDETLYGHNGVGWKEIKAIPDAIRYYYNRFNGTVTTTSPSYTGASANAWTHDNTSNCDGITISLSGTGTYKLVALSFGYWQSNPGTLTAGIRVAVGTSLGGTLVSQQSAVATSSTSTSSYNTITPASPITLNKGTTYSVAYALDPQNSVNVAQMGSGTSTSFGGTAGTMSIGNTTFNGPSPYGSSNGTGSTNGQIPVIIIDA